MDFPRYVFTSEGDQKCKLGTYGTEIVEDEAEFKAALKAGYVAEVTELFDKPVAKKFAIAPVKEDFDMEKIEDYTRPQLMAFLDEEEKEYDKKAAKPVLIELLKKAKEEDF